MTRVAAVAYPLLAAADQDWIEDIRGEYDPQAARLRAHFTLVFPVETEVPPLLEEVRATLSGSKPIPVAFGAYAARRDPLGESCHVFLLPGQGSAELHALHDRLYQGVLHPFLRSEVPYEPHVTVAVRPTLEECERIALNLERAERKMRGVVASLEVVDLTAWSLTTLARFALGGGMESSEGGET